MKFLRVTSYDDASHAMQRVWEHEETYQKRHTTFRILTNRERTHVWTEDLQGEVLLIGVLHEQGAVVQQVDCPGHEGSLPVSTDFQTKGDYVISPLCIHCGKWFEKTIKVD